MMDEFDDPELSSALRRHAERGGAPLDVGGAFESVRRRARRRRIRNGAVGTAGAAAAVAVVAVAIGALSPERDVVRTPSTVTADTGVVPSPPSPAPMTTVTAVPTSSPRSTTPRPTTATTSPRSTTTTRATTTTSRPVTTTSRPAGPAAPGTTETYSSEGGSITVRLADGHVSLVGAPEPAAGYAARIDEDGPYRVRVGFESDTGEAEIRVEVIDGRLSPTIRNPDSSGPGSDDSSSGPGSGDNSGPGSRSGSDSSGSGSSGSSGSGSG